MNFSFASYFETILTYMAKWNSFTSTSLPSYTTVYGPLAFLDIIQIPLLSPFYAFEPNFKFSVPDTMKDSTYYWTSLLSLKKRMSISEACLPLCITISKVFSLIRTISMFCSPTPIFITGFMNLQSKILYSCNDSQCAKLNYLQTSKTLYQIYIFETSLKILIYVDKWHDDNISCHLTKWFCKMCSYSHF